MSLATYIDHTALKAITTHQDIERLCQEALEYQFKSVCVAPAYVALASRLLADSNVAVGTVCSFPLGNLSTSQKADEAEHSVRLGAEEIDMVINLGLVKAGLWKEVERDIYAVRRATEGQILKVIIETAYLSDTEKQRAAEAIIYAEADFVKTSTGFTHHGATVQDIALLKSVVGDQIGIKASGGIRDIALAQALIDAGASRLGTSQGIALLQGQSNTGNVY